MFKLAQVCYELNLYYIEYWFGIKLYFIILCEHRCNDNKTTNITQLIYNVFEENKYTCLISW